MGAAGGSSTRRPGEGGEWLRTVPLAAGRSGAVGRCGAVPERVGKPDKTTPPQPGGLRRRQTLLLCGLLLAFAAEKSHEENELRLEDGVALQFADPVAVALLEAIESGRRPLDSGAQRRRTRDGAGRRARP